MVKLNQHLLVILITLLSTILAACCKKDPTVKKAGQSLLTVIESATEVGQWRRIEINPFQGEELFDLIDGGASVYLGCGLTRGIRAEYISPDSNECEIFAYEASEIDSVNNFFIRQIEDQDKVFAIEGYNTSQVKAAQFIGAILVFVKNGKSYFEMSISGYEDRKNAEAAAKVFLALLIV